MRGIKVFIGDTECFTIPDDSSYNGEWITIECDEGPVNGQKISLQQQRESKIVFCGIEVKGTEDAPLIEFETCDYSQENIWSDSICVTEITGSLITLAVFGGFIAVIVIVIIVVVV